MRAFHWCDFDVGPGDVPGPGGHARAAARPRACRSASGSTRTSRSARALFEEGRAARLPGDARRRHGLAVGPVAGRHGRWSTSPTPTRSPGTSGKLRRAARPGRRRFKTDFGERIPTDVVWHDGSDPRADAQLLHAPLQPGRLRRCSRPSAARARPCCSPGRPPPAASSSRCTGAATASRRSSRWRSRCAAGCRWRRRASASGATTSAASRARPTPAVFKRWLAFGLLSSHSRLHGSDSYRVPWAFDEEAVDVARQFTRLKLLAHAVPRRGCGRGRAHRRRAGDAADGAGVPRRPAARRPSTRSTCSATTCWSRRCSPPTATSTSTCPRARGRRCSPASQVDRPALGPRAARLRLAAAASPPGRGAAGRRARRTGRTTTGPTASRCACSSSPTGTGR